MARTFNPFAKPERSKVETPWGVFEIAPPNKNRLEQIAELQREAHQLNDDDLAGSVVLAIRTASAGLENGEQVQEQLLKAWDAGEVNVQQIRGLAEFVSAEIAGEVDEGND
jgi:hypothetical protein